MKKINPKLKFQTNLSEEEINLPTLKVNWKKGKKRPSVPEEMEQRLKKFQNLNGDNKSDELKKLLKNI